MPYRAIIIAALQSAGLYAAGIIPFIGPFALFLSPVPLILFSVRQGMRYGIAAIGVASVLVLFLGPVMSFVFLLSIGLMTAGIAEGMRRNKSPEVAILLGGAVPTLLFQAFAFLLFMKAGKNPFTTIDAIIHEGLAGVRKQVVDLKLTEVVASLDLVTDQMIYYFVRLLPGISLSISLLQATTCYGLARSLLVRRDPSSPLAASPSLPAWHAPDQWVWVFILSLSLIALPNVNARLLGLNVLLVYLLIYFAQAVALAEYYLRKAKIPVIWRTFLLTILFTLPLTAAPLLALGIIDIWADFRKIRKSAEA